ncbi:MAG TPA: hypothetical protein V6C52_03795 [Coleofasciculaceae cyanobacterium]|jgi:hypothetical protein
MNAIYPKSSLQFGALAIVENNTTPKKDTIVAIAPGAIDYYGLKADEVLLSDPEAGDSVQLTANADVQAQIQKTAQNPSRNNLSHLMEMLQDQVSKDPNVTQKKHTFLLSKMIVNLLRVPESNSLSQISKNMVEPRKNVAEGQPSVFFSINDEGQMIG